MVFESNRFAAWKINATLVSSIFSPRRVCHRRDKNRRIQFSNGVYTSGEQGSIPLSGRGNPRKSNLAAYLAECLCESRRRRRRRKKRSKRGWHIYECHLGVRQCLPYGKHTDAEDHLVDGHDESIKQRKLAYERKDVPLLQGEGRRKTEKGVEKGRERGNGGSRGERHGCTAHLPFAIRRYQKTLLALSLFSMADYRSIPAP